MTLRIIGDCHGKYDQYFKVIKDCTHSLQLGDMGFNYSPLSTLDHNHHVFFQGNHDNFDDLRSSPNFIGKFGYMGLGGKEFFWVGGSFSIDWKYREKQRLNGVWPRTWWPNEELSDEEMDEAEEWFITQKPRLMITHDCPRSIVYKFSNPEVLKSWGYNPDTFTTRTSEFLDRLFKQHQPKQWIFGHYHLRFAEIILGTDFRCLPELGYIDL